MGYTKSHNYDLTEVLPTNVIKGEGKEKEDETFNEKATRNWLDLPSDILLNILQRINVIGILRCVQKVCTYWRQICKDPCMWRVIYLEKKYYFEHQIIKIWACQISFPPMVYQKICKNVVDRSQGQLVDFTIKGFCDNALLRYVAERDLHMEYTKHYNLELTQVLPTNVIKGKEKQKEDETFKEKATRDWLDLPSDIMINILQRINVIGIVRSVQKVCTYWRQICKNPCMWRVIYLDDNAYYECQPNNTWSRQISFCPIVYQKMCKHVVDRSQGQLVDITMKGFCDNDLLLYVVERSNQIRRLEVEWSKQYIYDLPNALKKFPLLEELSLLRMLIPEGAIQTLGRDCPMLKTLKLNMCMLTDTWLPGLAIAENLPGLRHLELKWCKLTDTGLRAILDRCCHLQVLDLKNCYPINIAGELEKRCSQIKCMKYTDRSLSIMDDKILLSIIKSAYDRH